MPFKNETEKKQAINDLTIILKEMFLGGVAHDLPRETDEDRNRRQKLIHDAGLDVPNTQGVHISKPRRKRGA